MPFKNLTRYLPLHWESAGVLYRLCNKDHVISFHNIEVKHMKNVQFGKRENMV